VRERAHQRTDDQRQKRECDDEQERIHPLAGDRSERRGEHSAEREQQRRLPHDEAMPRRLAGAHEPRSGNGYQGDGDRFAGRGAEAVDEERHRKDRAAAAGKSERDADQRATRESEEYR
jgi:hypothetical protein